MQYWLIKSEPDAFSIDDLQAANVEPWDGIRNYQARNFMRDQMKVGDQVFFYHSSCAAPGIVGICEVASEPYPDPTAFDPEANYYDPKSDPDKPKWILVDMKFVKKLEQVISLAELKTMPELAEMRLLKKGNRLSIMPVEKSEWEFIMGIAG
ncbi:EVE domain-containing protein [Leucothrix pacifica]|uniref:EVE domain-containing protein n=1 Tax=Leucothrix pacifica TaxID=1247513 RepID=A0A317CTT8_9GAMM|nr:EVE domain-containing protein [Leucothrix pacifica]PWQ99870.1 EVE domain-containing protein [Leucothrix pacifica]